MTYDEMIAEYGDVKVKFSHYAKYVFYYYATLSDGRLIECKVCGDSQSAYDHNLSSEDFTNGIFVKQLYAYGSDVDVFDKDERVVLIERT